MPPSTHSIEDTPEIQAVGAYTRAIVKQDNPFPADFSVLFLNGTDGKNAPQPAYFPDLNLDVVVAAITADYAEYDLEPFFNRCLRDLASISFRQEVLRDLENEDTRHVIGRFAKSMQRVRQALTLASNLRNPQHVQAWKAKAIKVYCENTVILRRDLAGCILTSTGLTKFLDHLTAYVESPDFLILTNEVEKAIKVLTSISYAIVIKGDTFTVKKKADQPDLSEEVLRTFAKFNEETSTDYRATFPENSGMNHIEEKILEFVTALHPTEFAHIDNFHQRHGEFLHPAVVRFDREVQFYLSFLHFGERFKAVGLSLSYPKVSDTNKTIHVFDAYDIALATRLIDEKNSVVVNDIELSGRERLFVVSGPNQGGKTTFARTFGQLHHFACLGCQVPGREARLFLFRQIFTHFERVETLQSLRGKLEEDLTRIHAILQQTTSEDIIIFNEIFTSTTIQDALFLSERVMTRLIAKDVLAVWVTFIDELASFSDAVVSAVSTVDAQDLAHRTFKIFRRPADGLAYAISIAEKYGVTYKALKERIRT